MPRRPRRRTRADQEPLQPEQDLVVVCRGGDCGNRTKHPNFDHAAQLTRLREGLQGLGASVAVSKCLDACEHSNVIVVVPGPDARAAGVSPVWLGSALQEAVSDDLVEWLTSGGPVTAAPALVDILTFIPTRGSRHELSEPGTLPGS